MNTRERQIEQIAGRIADNMLYIGWTTNDAADQNRLGWTVEVSDLDNEWLRVRYEDVVLSPDELDRAIEMAYGVQEA
jgi:hypothetical protein